MFADGLTINAGERDKEFIRITRTTLISVTKTENKLGEIRTKEATF